MLGYVLANFFVYAGVNAFTPGPGNILALNTVTNYGWGKGKPLFFGIFAGYYAVQFTCAVFVYGVGEFLPHALPVMKYYSIISAVDAAWYGGLRRMVRCFVYFLFATASRRHPRRRA